ncbi:putative proteasome endopeptidase complex [Medicago truncatula]|uniref:Putative proteasome endopeptidase complex n=1 Tax=Medicago truncatula TaxID=3880 RepID=A0A396HDM7_MEDTR|nr:putative proteasome endopeptidase complex [Medicago truncatula]
MFAVYGDPIPVKELADHVASYIEKLKLADLTCRQGVIELPNCIYGVHDEAKDKDFELEMSWVCEESNRQHEKVRHGVLRVNLYFYVICD